jgi:hypothetical protein
MTLNVRNLALMALIVSCLMQVGAQLFAISVMVGTITEAPPRSFAILEGAHRYDSRAFWDTLPPITGLLFLIGIVANWRTARRPLLLLAFGLFIAAGVLAGVFLEPEFAKIIEGGFRDAVDPALKGRADRWVTLDWGVWSLSLVAGIGLLAALTIPSDARKPEGMQAN